MGRVWANNRYCAKLLMIKQIRLEKSCEGVCVWMRVHHAILLLPCFFFLERSLASGHPAL